MSCGFTLTFQVSSEESIEAGHLAPENREARHVRRVEPVAHRLKAAVAVLAAPWLGLGLGLGVRVRVRAGIRVRVRVRVRARARVTG